MFIDYICQLMLGPRRPIVKDRFAKFGRVIRISTVLNQNVDKISVSILDRAVNWGVVNFAYRVRIRASIKQFFCNIQVVQFARLMQGCCAHLTIKLIGIESAVEAKRYAIQEILDHQKIKKMLIADPFSVSKLRVSN